VAPPNDIVPSSPVSVGLGLYTPSKRSSCCQQQRTRTAVNTYEHRLLRKVVVGFPVIREIQGVLFRAGPSNAETATSPAAVQQQAWHCHHIYRRICRLEESE
jgi:hypothetical protein